MRIAGDRVGRDKNGVAVRRTLGGVLDADGAVGARLVLDVDLLAECPRQVLGDQAGAHIGRAARRKRHDETDRLGGIGLGVRGPGPGRGERQRRQRQRKMPPGDHGPLPVKIRGASRTFGSNASASAGCQRATLLDHLVGLGQQRRGDGEAESLGSLEVDDELILGWLLYRQIARFLASQNAIGIGRSLPHQADDIGTVGHETAGRREMRSGHTVGRRPLIARSKIV